MLFKGSFRSGAYDSVDDDSSRSYSEEIISLDTIRKKNRIIVCRFR